MFNDCIMYCIMYNILNPKWWPGKGLSINQSILDTCLTDTNQPDISLPDTTPPHLRHSRRITPIGHLSQ